MSSSGCNCSTASAAMAASEKRRRGAPEIPTTRSMLLLADDLMTVARSVLWQSLYMWHLEMACRHWCLVISPAKMECMVVDGREQLSESSSLELNRCQICERKVGDDKMLLCECCAQGAHWRQCLQLKGEPEAQWYCTESETAAAASGGVQHISRKAPIRIAKGVKQLEWARKFKYLGSVLAA